MDRASRSNIVSRRRRWVLLLATIALAPLAFAGRAAGQSAPTHRRLLDLVAPAPLDNGVIRDDMMAPDSAAHRRRATLRVDGPALDRLGRSGASYRAGRVLLKFRDGTTPADRRRALDAVSRSLEMLPRGSSADFDVIRTSADSDAEALADALQRDAAVEYAQADYRVRPMLVPNDPNYRLQWNLPLIDIERAWDIQPAAGSSIVVAVLDTGIAYTNATVQFFASAFSIDADGDIGPPARAATNYPALGNLTLSFVAAPQLVQSGRFVAPHDFIWDDTLPLDLDGHGTHVSGTIGQVTHDGTGEAGIAFNVKLMPVKVIDSEWDDIFGSPEAGTDQVLARGIRYAADNGAKVINLSLERTGPPAPAVEDAIRYAVSRGAFLAIAAGNDFENGNPTEVLAEIASRVPGAVSVAAVDRNRQHAYYSSAGPWVEIAAPGGSFRGFAADGGILQQTLDLQLVDTFLLPPPRFAAPRFDAVADYYFTGTSSATPHVAGLAALLMQQGITSPAAIEAALERFATDLGDPGRDNLFGFGLLEARNTLRGLGLAR
jgi:serine protease